MENDIVDGSKSTIESEYFEPEATCPKCGSSELKLITKFYLKNGEIRIFYKCFDCGSSFQPCKTQNRYKYKRPHSQSFRFHVLKKFENKCAICGSSKDLEAHHIIPVSITRKTEQELEHEALNGVCLCKYHHLLAHGKLDEAREYKSEMVD